MAVSFFRNKKGFFFTIIAVLIMSVLFVSFSPRSDTTLKDKLPLTESRISTANDFVETLETSYLPTALRVSSYNALNSLSIYLKQRGTTLLSDYEQLNAQFTELMVNGSIECATESLPIENKVFKDVETCVCVDLLQGCDPDSTTLMKGRTFRQRLGDIQSASESTLKIQTAFHDSHLHLIRLFQNSDTGPFQVGVNTTINFSVDAGMASWQDAVSIPVIFSFEGIEDPLYSVKSKSGIGELYTNVFNQTELTSWGVPNTFLEIEQREYKYDKKGSSFLTRFTENDEASECCGIESLINTFAMRAIELQAIEEAYVDWCFFGSRCPGQQGELWYISCITDTSPSPEKFYRFSLDAYHAAAYGMTDFIYKAEPDPKADQCNILMQPVCDIDPDTTCT